MPYRKKRFVAPSMLLHASGQAFVKFDGDNYYLGKYGSAAAHKEYLRIVPHLEARFHAKAAGISEPLSADKMLIAEGIAQYLWHLEHDEDGDLLPSGKLSSHFAKAKDALAPLDAAFGDMLLAEFTAENLKTLRTIMRAGQWEAGRKAWAPSYTNSAIANVRRFFAWCEVEGYVEEGKGKHLEALKPLREPPRPERAVVEDDDMEIVCRYASPTVAAMVRIQRLTAARPSEVCIMRPCDIDMQAAVWVYWPSNHKTQYRDKKRAIPLGFKCQAILRPFLDNTTTSDGYLFRPADALQWSWNNRSRAASTGRKTPIYPSEIRRREQLKKQRMARRKQKPVCAPCYNRVTYRQAIMHAIAKAKASGESVNHWYPYQLRHTRLTEVQDQYGWEDAAAVAGHESIDTTKQYAHRRLERALRIAADTQTPR